MFRIFAKQTGNGVSVGLFIPLPDELAKEFPSLKPEDDSPPHCTLSYIGDVPKKMHDEVLATIDQICASFNGPVKASLGQLDYFKHPDKDRTVAILPVRFDRDIAGLRYRIYVAMRDLGLNPPEYSPLVYNAHVTLAYLPGLDAQYKGVIPQGSWLFDSVEVWGMPKLQTIYFGAKAVHEIVAERFATKTKPEKEDEEAERLVRPSPPKKPPRKDLRRERVKEGDPDVDAGDRGDDDDLSLNYKRVARRWVAGAKKKDQEPEWAKGKKFKHKTEGGESSEVGWGSLTPEEREKYTKEQKKEQDEAVDREVFEVADEVDLNAKAKEQAEKELARLQKEDPNTKETIESVKKRYIDRAMRSMRQPIEQKKKLTEEQAEKIVEESFEETSKELGGEGGDAEKETPKEDAGSKKEKPKEEKPESKPEEKPEDKPKEEGESGGEGSEESKGTDADARYQALDEAAGGDLGPIERLPKNIRGPLKNALRNFSEDQIKTLTDSFKGTMDVQKKNTPSVGEGWSGRTVDDAREALQEGVYKDDDPGEIGEQLAKMLFAERVVFNPSWAGGDLIKDTGKPPSNKALKDRETRAFEQYNDLMDSDERKAAATEVEARLKELDPESSEAQQLNAVLDGIAMSQIINGEEVVGRQSPSEAFANFAKALNESGDAESLAGTLRDPQAANKLIRDKFKGMPDSKVMEIAGGSDGPLKELGEFLDQRDEFGNFPFGEEHHEFVKQVLREIAADNMTLNHRFVAALTGDSKKADDIIGKETKKNISKNRKLLGKPDKGESFLKNMLASLAKALKDIERRGKKQAAQSFVYNVTPISGGLHFAQQQSSGTALLKRRQRRMIMSRLSKQAAQRITNDLDRLASLFQKEHERLGVSEKVALDFAYRCDLLSDHLDKQALTEYDPVDESKMSPHNFDPEEIGKEDAGPLVDEPDEPYMKGEFTQQRFRELRERQEAGEIGDKPIMEEQTPTPGKQASLNDSIARLKKKASGSLQSVLTLGEMADRLRLCQAELKQIPASIGGALAKDMGAAIQRHLTPIDAVRNSLFSLEGKGESMDIEALAAVEKIEGAVQEVLPHIKGIIRKLSEEEVAESPTAQLRLQEWLDTVSPRVTMLLDLSAKLVAAGAKEFALGEKAEKAASEAAPVKEASDEEGFDHGYDLSE